MAPVSKRVWTEEEVEQIIGNLLRAGVITAAVIVLASGVYYLIQQGSAPADFRTFHGEPAEERRLLPMLQAALGLDARALIQLGLILLIATPVLRVAFSVYAFARQHDFTYVVITLIVLGILLYSLFNQTF